MSDEKFKSPIGLLAKSLVQATQLLDDATQQAAQEIGKLPQNPKIHQRSKGMYTIAMSDLGKSWTTFHQDWKIQHEMLAQMVLDQHFGTLNDCLVSGKHPTTRDLFDQQVIRDVRAIVGNFENFMPSSKAENKGGEKPEGKKYRP